MAPQTHATLRGMQCCWMRSRVTFLARTRMDTGEVSPVHISRGGSQRSLLDAALLTALGRGVRHSKHDSHGPCI